MPRSLPGGSLVLSVALCAIAATEVSALDPFRRLTQYVQVRWRMEDGLPHNTIRAVIQSRDGYIWLGTYGGLVRFDGVRFRVFDNLNSGLRDNEVRSLAEGPDGAIWVGTTSGGLHRFANDRLEPFTQGIEHRTINALLVSDDGSLWVGSSGGVYRLRDGVMRRFAESEGLVSSSVNELALDETRPSDRKSTRLNSSHLGISFDLL